MKFVTALVLGSTLFALAACGDATQTQTPSLQLSPTRTPPRPTVVVPTLAPGWSPYSRSTYQIALPDTWDEIELADEELKRTIIDAQINNPPLADLLSALLESGQSKTFVFYATDSTKGPILRNISIARVALAGTNDLNAYTHAYADALPNVVRGSRVIQVQTPLEVNGMNAAQIVYDISLVNTGGTLTTVRGVQYLYQLATGDTYVVTVTGDAADQEEFMPLAHQIGTSFVGINR